MQDPLNVFFIVFVSQIGVIELYIVENQELFFVITINITLWRLHIGTDPISCAVCIGFEIQIHVIDYQGFNKHDVFEK